MLEKKTLIIYFTSRNVGNGGGDSDAAATQSAADLAAAAQGNVNTIPERAEEEDGREGEASDEERGEQDGL